nr:hypothetical protein [Morchella crassipes]
MDFKSLKASPSGPWGPPHTASFARIPPPPGGKNSPSGAAFLHAVRAAPPRAARGGGYPQGPPGPFSPPPSPPPLPTVGSGGEWEGGWGGCAAGSSKNFVYNIKKNYVSMQPLLNMHSSFYLSKKDKRRGVQEQGRGAAESVPLLMGYPPPPPSLMGGVFGICPRTHGGPHGASKGGGSEGGCTPPLFAWPPHHITPPVYLPPHLWGGRGRGREAKGGSDERGRCVGGPHG